MKILLVAANSDYTKQLKRGFEKNSAEVFYLEERSNFLVPSFWRENIFLWRFLRRTHRLRRLNNKLFAENLVKTAIKVKPDVIFFSKVMIVKPATLAELNRLGFKTANWFTDNVFHPRYRSWFIGNYKYYDYFFVFDSGAKDLVYPAGGSLAEVPAGLVPSGASKTSNGVKNEPESRNVIYMPMAIEPETYQLEEELTEEDRKKYTTDVCFVGAIYPERERVLSVIRNLGLKIYGWKGWEKSSLAGYYLGPLNVIEMVKLYKTAKICINMNLEPACNGVNWKTFEITAAGGFQLTDYRNDLGGLFRIGQELDIFHSPEELREKVLFYLNNDDLRRKIARAGRQRVLADHGFKKRIKSALTALRC